VNCAVSENASRQERRKALSWEDLHFEVSASIRRFYRKAVFLELDV
jgi:hypothetical protein